MHARARGLAHAVCGILPLVVLSAPIASAQESPLVADPARAEATVVRVDGADLFADVPNGPVGATYRIFRPLTVRHPITGRSLRDRFPIGRARLVSTGAALSVLRADDGLDRDAAVGDILVPEFQALPPGPSQAPGRERAQAVAPPPHPAPEEATPPAAASPALPPIVSPGAAPPRAPSLPGTSGDEREILEVWAQTLGKSLEVRIRLYRAYLTARPQSPYAAQVRREILALGSLVGSPSTTLDAASPAPRHTRPELRGEPAGELRTGDPAVVAFQLPRDSGYSTGLLHVRGIRDATYSQIVLRVEGDGYMRAEVPARFVRPPGLAYFVEVVAPDGVTLPVVGTAAAPVTVVVRAPARPAAAAEGRSRVDLRSEVADVGTGTFHGVYRPEWFLLLEGDFLQRVRWSRLYGYRVGFGLYRGQGQPLSAYESADAPPARTGTVVYGYHELELELTSFVHAMLRAQVGMHEQGLVGGGQLRFRIGHEQRTNVVVGGDLLGEVGQKAFFTFTFFPIAELPVVAQGEVFNQEIDGGDPMFRLVCQVGYRVAPWLALSARGSYQLRNIHHGGFGGGAAVTLDW